MLNPQIANIAHAADQVQNNFAPSFITLLVKIALVIAAVFVPTFLGDKLAKGISGTIGNLSKNTKKHLWGKSEIGADMAARRKAKESDAFTGALGRMAAGNKISNKLGNMQVGGKALKDRKIGQALGLRSVEQKTGAAAMAMKNHESTAENMTKEQRNEFLESRGYTKMGADGVTHFVNKEKFDKDYLAQAVLLAQSDSGLLNDDKSNKLRYLNQMRGHMLKQGRTEFVTSNSKNGGYDLMQQENLDHDAGQALGMLTSAIRNNFSDPDKLSGIGSEFADQFMYNYRNIDLNKDYTWINKEDGQTVTANGYAIVHGADHEKAKGNYNGSGIDGIIKSHVSKGNIEKIFTSDQSGGKAMKPFIGGDINEKTGEKTFMGLLRDVNGEAHASAVNYRDHYKKVGVPSMHTTEGGSQRPSPTGGGGQGPTPAGGAQRPRPGGGGNVIDLDAERERRRGGGGNAGGGRAA